MSEMSMNEAVIDFADKYFDEYEIHGEELIPEYCPYCGGGKHKDRKTFAINLETGSWNCMRGSCNSTGSFRKLCDDFARGEIYRIETRSKMNNLAKHYDRPEEGDLRELTQEVIDYFATRGISEETLRACRVCCDDKGNIVFPFYRDDKLIFVKKREPHKYEKGSGKEKEWCIKNTEPILFGMDAVSFNKRLYITEGMIDALSLYEAGITNVVSVPMGCKYLDWVVSCREWLENFEEIAIFGDNDAPGLDMQIKVMHAIGEDVCMLAPEYPELVYGGNDFGRLCKDANEILVCYGPETLNEIAMACEPAPINGLLNLGKVHYVDPANIPRISTDIPELDSYIGGFGEGDLVVLTGKRGSGKSTVGGNFCLNALNHGYNVCAYSGELSTSNFLNWIALQATERKYIGYKMSKITGKNYAVISPDIQERIQRWLDGKFFLFDNESELDDYPEETMMKLFRACAKRYHCKMFLVDNLMALTGGREDEYAAQTKITRMLKNFAMKYKVTVILVCHPRKTKQDAPITNDDVAGSANITNLADTVLNIEKPNIRVLKNRAFGTCGVINCDYDPTNRRIYQSDFGDVKVYNWDHTGIAEPEYKAANLKEFAIVHTTEQPI